MKYSERNSTGNGTKKSKVLMYVLVILLLVAGGVFAFAQLRSDNQNSGKEAQDESSINFGPPTEEEQRAGDEIKEQIVEQREDQDESDNNASTTEKQNANVIIVDASQYGDVVEVRAFVNNHIEDGTCTFRFSNGSNTVEESVPAYADASTTVCPALEVDRSAFSTAGDWSLVVIYTSNGAEGSSKPTIVAID